MRCKQRVDGLDTQMKMQESEVRRVTATKATTEKMDRTIRGSNSHGNGQRLIYRIHATGNFRT